MSTSLTPAIHWIGNTDGFLQLIDQTLLPAELKLLECRTVEQVWEAIKSLRVRGAPAIGVAAAYGVIVGCQIAMQSGNTEAMEASREEFGRRLRLEERLVEVLDYSATSRPTAVNLFWALDRMRKTAASTKPGFSSGKPGFIPNPEESPANQSLSRALLERLLEEARAIEAEDREMCAAIGRFGAELLKNCT